MNAKTKILISLCVVAFFAIPTANAAITTQSLGPTLECTIDADNNAYINPANEKLYFKDTDLKLEFEGSSSVRAVKIWDNNGWYAVTKDLLADGTLTVSLEELVATNPGRAFYEHYHMIQYMGLDWEGKMVVGPKTTFKVINAPVESTGLPIRVDTTSPVVKEWEIKSGLLGLGEFNLVITTSDEPITATPEAVQSGIQYIKVTTTVKELDGLEIVEKEVEIYNKIYNETSAAITVKIPLYQTIIDGIKFSGFKVELQDYAGHTPAKTCVSPDEIEFKSKPVAHPLFQMFLERFADRFPILAKLF